MTLKMTVSDLRKVIAETVEEMTALPKKDSEDNELMRRVKDLNAAFHSIVLKDTTTVDKFYRLHRELFNWAAEHNIPEKEINDAIMLIAARSSAGL